MCFCCVRFSFSISGQEICLGNVSEMTPSVFFLHFCWTWFLFYVTQTLAQCHYITALQQAYRSKFFRTVPCTVFPDIILLNPSTTGLSINTTICPECVPDHFQNVINPSLFQKNSPFPKFTKNPPLTFLVILLTKQTNGCENNIPTKGGMLTPKIQAYMYNNLNAYENSDMAHITTA